MKKKHAGYLEYVLVSSNTRISNVMDDNTNDSHP